MNAETIEVDSRLLGRAVLAIDNFDQTADFASFERDYIAAHSPAYVTCRVPVENIREIHALEDAGFHLIECQIRSAIKLRKFYDVLDSAYHFQEVRREEELTDVLRIAGTTFVHDRFALDPATPAGFSGERYRQYVLRSFHASDECVYRLIDRQSGCTVGFKTHRYVSPTEVLFLLGGVDPDLKDLGLGVIAEYFEFNELIRKGVTRGITHISACNYPVFNLEIGRLGFRVLATLAVMRKVYPG